MESTFHLKTFNRLHILYYLFLFHEEPFFSSDRQFASISILIFSRWSSKTVSIRGMTKSSDKNYVWTNLRRSHSISSNWRRVMKASSPVKLIWNLSFYPLSFPLSFLEICSWHFSVFFIPTSSTTFPRLVKKRKTATRSLFSGFRFVLSSAKWFENHHHPWYHRSLPPFLPAYFRGMLACEKPVVYLTY